MKIDISNVGVALCLAIIGFYFGASFGKMTVIDIVPLLSFIVSICMLIVAQQALSTWKNQFKHQVLYKSLVNAEQCFKNYCTSEEALRVECIKRRHKNGEDFTLPFKCVDIKNRKKSEYRRCWDELAIICVDFTKDNEWLDPDILSKGYTDEAVRMHNEDFRPFKSGFYQMHEENLKQGIGAFHKRRTKLS